LEAFAVNADMGDEQIANERRKSAGIIAFTPT